MIRNYRKAIASLIGGLAICLGTGAAYAEGWRDNFDKLVISVIPNESDTTLIARFNTLTDYLQKHLGVPVTIRQATDYAGVIEAIRGETVQFGRFGPASYAQAWRVTGGKVRPMIAEVDSEGNLGYYSVIAVRADSSYKTVEDLKGKRLAFADPNSTSGYLAPSFFLREQGIDPDTHFAETQFAGGHDQGILAMINGTVDAMATGWTSDTANNCTEMSERGLIEKGVCRFIWKSPRLPSSLWAAAGNVPEDLEADFAAAMMKMKDSAPDAWATFIAGNEFGGYVKASQADYEAIIRMIEENQRQRRAK